MPNDTIRLVKPHVMLSKMGTVLLLAQPFFTFPIFLSVLLGVPPLWLSWLIAIIPWPMRFFITGRLTCRTPFDIAILISIAGMLLGLILSPDHQLSLPILHTYLACVLFYYGVVNNSQARLPYWVFGGVLLCVIVLLLSLLHFVSGVGKHLVFNSWAYELASSLPYPLGITIDNNILGMAFGVIIPGLFAIILFQQSAWVRWSAGILVVVFGGILVLSASGFGWIFAMMGMLVVLLCRDAKIFWGTLAALVVAIGAAFPFWHNANWVGRVFNFDNVLARLEIWQATIATLTDYPLIGLGLGGWWSKLFAHGELESHPHSAYLQLYSDTGALGLMAFIIAAIVSVRLFWQILHSDKDSPYYGITLGIAAGIIVGGIYGLVDANASVLIPIGNEYIYFSIPFLWLWAALFVIFSQRLLGNTEKHKRIGPFRWISGGFP